MIGRQRNISSSGRNNQGSHSCLKNALTRWIHYTPIGNNFLDGVISQLLFQIALLQFCPSCFVFLPHGDSFCTVSEYQSRVLLALAAVNDCMAWLHMLSRCALCGISGWLNKLSDDKQRIGSDHSWLWTCSHLQRICLICFVTGVYTQVQPLWKNMHCSREHVNWPPENVSAGDGNIKCHIPQLYIVYIYLSGERD